METDLAVQSLVLFVKGLLALGIIILIIVTGFAIIAVLNLNEDDWKDITFRRFVFYPTAIWLGLIIAWWGWTLR